ANREAGRLRVEPPARGAGHRCVGRTRRALWRESASAQSWALAVDVHVRSRPHHRRRHGADSKEHHLGTRAEHAARTQNGELSNIVILRSRGSAIRGPQFGLEKEKWVARIKRAMTDRESRENGIRTEPGPEDDAGERGAHAHASRAARSHAQSGGS